MPSIGDNPALRLYGPGQADYEYDGKVGKDMDAEQEMSPIGKMLFEQMHAVNEGQARMLHVGREQMAREVMGWVTRTGLHRFGDVPIGELVEICRKAGA